MMKITKNIENINKNQNLSIKNGTNRGKFSFNENINNISFGASISAKNVAKAKEAFLKSTGINLEPLITELKNNNLLSIANDGAVTLFKKNSVQLMTESIFYPFVKLPLDLAEWGASFLKKVPGLKTVGNKIYNSGILQRNRNATRLQNSLYSVSGILNDFSSTAEGKLPELVLKSGHTKFNPAIGRYDSKKERAANRIVSGVSTAFFLANDAYNLSRICDDDPQKAAMEKNVRFKQELLRIASMSYLNFVIMSAFPKLMNSSKAFIITLNTATIFISEVIARWINGKSATFISPEKAVVLHKKEEERLQKALKRRKFDKIDKKQEKSVIKWSVYSPNDVKNVNNKKVSSEDKKNVKDTKPLVSLSALAQWALGLGLSGFALIGLRKYSPKFDKFVNNFLNYGKNIYNRIVKKDFTMPVEQFEKYMKKFEDSGLEPLAKKYREIANANTVGGVVKFEKLDKKYKYLVDFVIAPFKFVWGTLSLPTNLTKKILSACGLIGKKSSSKYNPNQVLTRVMNTLQMSKTFDLPNDKFRQAVSKNIINSFNDVTSSKISNAEISKLAVTASSFATMIFKIADHYNMVMTKSKGKDIEGAEMKARERGMQEVSRLFYKTLVIDTFNKAFSNMYHASITGASAVTTAAQVLSEALTRKSVGIPIAESTKDEIIKTDIDNENKKGIVGSYFRFMTKLTGKKPLSQSAHGNLDNQKVISIMQTPDVSAYFKKA